MCHNAQSFDPMRKLMKENAMCFINIFFLYRILMKKSLGYRKRIKISARADF